MNTAIGWLLSLLFVNYLVYSITGVPYLWCLLTVAAEPLSYYVAIVNLTLATGIVIGGIWNGPVAALKMATLMFGFNLVPAVMAALMAFGYRCG